MSTWLRADHVRCTDDVSDAVGAERDGLPVCHVKPVVGIVDKLDVVRIEHAHVVLGPARRPDQWLALEAKNLKAQISETSGLVLDDLAKVHSVLFVDFEDCLGGDKEVRGNLVVEDAVVQLLHVREEVILDGRKRPS